MNNVVSLDSLFHKRVFRIPDYQRGYSWETRQVREFLEDLEILGPSNCHYTGTVVLHVLDSEPVRMDRDGNQYEIVSRRSVCKGLASSSVSGVLGRDAQAATAGSMRLRLSLTGAIDSSVM